MMFQRSRRVAGMLAVGALLGAPLAIPSYAQTMAPAAAQGEAGAIARARADSIRRPYTQADIDFMKGMIANHSQAIVMAKWAPSHGASAALQVMCARIINAQRDEILIMQSWLRDRNQEVPAPDTLAGMGMMMHGGHHMLMPGMLSAEQMHQLDQARGKEFDKLFLQFMIQHHQGAVSMVDDLFGTYGAAQDQLTFKLANDISADQTSEITRMQKMLVAQMFGPLPADANP
jgi:uncharacterized protein (DUF305 family)